MDDYNIWQDLFDTIQSFPDWLIMAALLIQAATLIIIIQQFLTYRMRRAEHSPAAAPSPPPLPPPSPLMPHYRGTIDEQGVLYLEPVTETKQVEDETHLQLSSMSPRQ